MILQQFINYSSDVPIMALVPILFPLLSICFSKPWLPVFLPVFLSNLGDHGVLPLQIEEDLLIFQHVQFFLVVFRTEWQLLSSLHVVPETMFPSIFTDKRV